MGGWVLAAAAVMMDICVKNESYQQQPLDILSIQLESKNMISDTRWKISTDWCNKANHIIEQMSLI